MEAVRRVEEERFTTPPIAPSVLDKTALKEPLQHRRDHNRKALVEITENEGTMP
jgi:hypothetical protein